MSMHARPASRQGRVLKTYCTLLGVMLSHRGGVADSLLPSAILSYTSAVASPKTVPQHGCCCCIGCTHMQQQPT